MAASHASASKRRNPAMRLLTAAAAAVAALAPIAAADSLNARFGRVKVPMTPDQAGVSQPPPGLARSVLEPNSPFQIVFVNNVVGFPADLEDYLINTLAPAARSLVARSLRVWPSIVACIALTSWAIFIDGGSVTDYAELCRGLLT